MNKSKSRYIKIAGAAFVIFSVLFYFFNTVTPNRPAGRGDRVFDFEIDQGIGPARVGRNLEEAGIIRDAEFFRFMLRITGRAGSIKTGLYELNDGMTTMRVIDILTEGRVQTTSLTVPEGWNNRQIGEYLAEHGYVSDKDEFIRLTKDEQVLKEFHIVADSTEGYLFPDTYVVPKRFPADKIHRNMLRHFFKKLEEADIPEHITPYQLHDGVILASIIEREAVHPDELPVMASVFINRVKKRMRLESCATVQYLLPNPKKKLFEKDLLVKSPYNTYLHSGMPPGPISNPGLPALKAAFHPAKTSFLFFVLKPKEGRHHFSNSYSEHLRAKKKYLGE